jgi:hypothetical protein
MCFKTSFRFLVCFLWLMVILFTGCVPPQTTGPETAPTLMSEPLTPTPEIFSALAPSPTPPDSALPLTCQVTDLGVYINHEWGYCFAYPGIFTLDESLDAEGVITLYGPALEDNADPVRVSLEVTAQLVPPGSTLTPLVDAYMNLFPDPAWQIRREPARLGSEPAEMLQPIPGLLSSRVLLAVHENTLFTLRFHPSDIEFAKPGLEELVQTVTGSFAFLPATAVSQSNTVSWREFGQTISLSYDSTLAPWVDAWTAPAVPISDQILFAEAQPAQVHSASMAFMVGGYTTCLCCPWRAAWRRSESFRQRTSPDSVMIILMALSINCPR